MTLVILKRYGGTRRLCIVNFFFTRGRMLCPLIVVLTIVFEDNFSH